MEKFIKKNNKFKEYIMSLNPKYLLTLHCIKTIHN